MKVLATEFLKSIPGVFGIHFDEHAPYDIIQTGPVEVRCYKPMTLASCRIESTHETATNTAFTILAEYIFSHNIPMTVPVFQHMDNKTLTLSFYIADDENLPEPSTNKIKLHSIPERFVGVYGYSGINMPRSMLKAKNKLLELVPELKNYTPSGEVFWAQYDSPMTIPFLRKNEAMILLKQNH
jgi:hypothetical protein